MKLTTSQQSFYKPISFEDPVYRDVRQILVVSDLHISEGYSQDTYHWNRLENFTSDTAFARFLGTKSKDILSRNCRAWLIINGDFIDFLRITSTPKSNDELQEWRQWLKDITEAKLPDQRERVLKAFDEFARLWRACVLDNRNPKRKWPCEIKDRAKYGLRTNDFESIDRLMIAMKGHSEFFQALAEWLSEGHLLTVISGNHDHEFDQDLVRAGFLWMLEKLSGEKRSGHQYDADFSERLRFEKHGLEIGGKIRVEHGHRFEWHTRTTDQWLRPDSQEIILAPGSLFNRYLINHLELEVPYLNNIKPVTHVIGYLIKKHPYQFLKMVWKLLKAVYRLARKRGPRRLIFAGFLKVIQCGLPLLYLVQLVFLLLRLNGESLSDIFYGTRFLGIPFPIYIAIPFFILYFLIISSVVKGLKLYFSEEEMRQHMSRGFEAKNKGDERYAICGHTHEPHKERWDNTIIFMNAGTWIPVFEQKGGYVRDDMTMTFVELNKSTTEWDAKLARWEPLTMREAEVILIEERKKKGGG